MKVSFSKIFAEGSLTAKDENFTSVSRPVRERATVVDMPTYIIYCYIKCRQTTHTHCKKFSIGEVREAKCRT